MYLNLCKPDCPFLTFLSSLLAPSLALFLLTLSVRLAWFLWRQACRLESADPESVITELEAACTETHLTQQDGSVSDLFVTLFMLMHLAVRLCVIESNLCCVGGCAGWGSYAISKLYRLFVLQSLLHGLTASEFQYSTEIS
jgi:hypothetical protein